MATLGNVIIVAGIVFMFFGIIGIFKFPSFYKRILISAKIDTVGILTIIIGMGFRQGFSFFTMKLLLIAIILLILNPLSTHIIARCAYRSKYSLVNDKAKESKSKAIK